MTEALIVVCPHCHSPNRVPSARLGEGGTCGKCKQALFAGAPVELDSASFDKHLGRSELPLEAGELAARYGTRSIPTLVAFQNGREVARQSGAMDAATLVRWIRNSMS